NLTRRGMDATLRMFSTRTNYWAEFGVDTTLAALLIFEGWRLHTGGLLMAFAAIALGLLVYSFAEYCFHRWLFHTRIPLFEQGHRTHHEQPLGYDSLPFFLPAIVVLGLTGLGVLIMPTGFAFLMTGTMTLGYVFYGLSHYTIHHVRFRQPLLRRWAASHHIHHHHPHSNFGVTTPLWDILLGTRYVQQSRKA
ncbi:MAG: sterol desaturase family protein, partial [Gammaproteobacteria bacterium]